MTTADHPALTGRQIGAVVLGNGLEFYDFLTFSFFAAQIGRTFFPSTDPQSSLLMSLATFGAGFLTRPVGAICIGWLADRTGRKPAMLLSFLLMGLGIVGMACTPAYREIGVAAPLLVLFWRLVQGFALGGDVGPTTAMLVEGVPAHRRGMFGSLQNGSQFVAVCAAGLVGFVLSNHMDAKGLDDWGWRAAFLIGACVVPIGFLVRRALPETLHATTEDEATSPQPAATRLIVLGLVMLISGTVMTYVLNNLSVYASQTLHLSTQQAFFTTMLRGACCAVACVFSGWLSDRVGRRAIMIPASFFMAVASVPLFWAMVHFHNALVLNLATVAMAIATGMSFPPVLTALTEGLPRRVRAGTVAIVYAFAISVFGGSTQFVVTWLTGLTGNPLTPGWYMAGAAVLGLAAMAMLPETAPCKLNKPISADLVVQP